MSKHKIDTEFNMPDDNSFLKHKNFEEVLQKTTNTKELQNNVKQSVFKKYMFWGSIGIASLVLGFVLGKYYYQKPSSVQMFVQAPEKKDLFLDTNINTNIVLDTNNSTSETPEIQIDTNSKIKTITSKNKSKYLEPQLANGPTFMLSKAFNLQDKLEELSIYKNLVFEPISIDFDSAWLFISWDKASLSKDNEKYILHLEKKQYKVSCQVKPVFLEQDFEEALKQFDKEK